MKKFVLLFTISTFSLAVFAQQKSKTRSHSPRVYIMMKKGKLIEVNRGHRKLIKKDVTLVNQTTIHPNGSIDASSGQNLQLKEGEYITMDGRIRNLKDMVRSTSGKR
ncbi:MAG TPA: DUF6799 domain-containing protein [Puia sp.]